VLIPVPEKIASKLSATSWLAWREQAVDWTEVREGEGDQTADDVFGLATAWGERRFLPTGYLRSGPNIWFWNDGKNIHIEWDNREEILDGMVVWEANVGSWSMSVDAFLQEIRSFDRRFIQAVQQRVDQVTADWPYSEIFLDKQRLVLEHQDRAMWLERSLS